LNITGNSGTDLRWDSLSDTSWDAIATNWFDLNSSQPSVFFSGDTALLDDTAGVTTSITIAPGVTVAPSVLSNTSTNNSFTISGAGRIGGSASIVKSGLATLAINTANTFSGAVDVQAGTLQTGNASALGSTVAGTTVEPGATLDLNGQNLGGEAITISGDGVNGGGALANNGAGQAQALRQLILAGDATIGGTGLLGMNNSGGAASLAGAFSLTKVGPNQFTLQNAGVDANLANIDIRQGIIEFSGLTSTMGDAAFTNTVEVGATLSFSQNTIVWNKQFVFNGDGVTTTVNIGTSGNEALAGPVVLHGDCVFNVGGTSLTISNLSGDGGLIKIGGSPLILPGTNTYSGDTRINVAALRLNENGSISGSSNIVISAGATLSVTGRVDATFTLVTNQTLKGNGVINGSVIASNGSTVAPGIDAIGALTVSNAVTLAGTTEMELDPSNGTNDLLRCNSSITYGGTLNLVNLGGSLANGSSFKLFNAASYLGAFASITPSTPGPGQTWDISALGTSGTIKIAAVAQPSFTSISLVGSSLVMRGSNGAVSSPYYVLASTNLILPRSSWTRIATNAFDANGNFVFTNAVNPAIRQRFYLIQLP
jgi:autotransporter-associated beta strand protein